MPTTKNRNTLSLITILSLVAACGADRGADEPAPAASDPADAAPSDAAPAAEGTSAFVMAPLVDPNTVPADVLAAVPGMTDAAAAAIVAGRPFSTPTELDAAIGDALDDADRKAVYAQVFIKVGLNSGAEEDYKLIPSTLAPGHLAHEIEEYRPYESTEQFRREMSKYVSDEEAAYLVRFVTLD